MADVVLGTAGSGDVEELLDFWVRAAENASRPMDRAEALIRLLARDPEAVIIARAGGRLVGTVIVGWDGWRCHLYRLAVDPEFRGRAIGRQLVSAAEDRARAFGVERVDAMVLDANIDARKAWTRLGYERQPDWSRWVGEPGHFGSVGSQSGAH